MVKSVVKVVNPTGLHARPASQFVNAAGKFKSDLKIGRTADDVRLNAKSIIGVLSLALCQGEEIEISAEGEDEQEAVDKLSEMVRSGFGEV